LSERVKDEQEDTSSLVTSSFESERIEWALNRSEDKNYMHQNRHDKHCSEMASNLLSELLIECWDLRILWNLLGFLGKNA